MKQVLKSLIVLVLVGLMSTSSTKASHIAAVDVYYEYLAPLQYRVHLKLYRDCSGITLGGTQFMQIYSNNCNINQPQLQVDTANANDPNNGAFVDELCQNVQSNCYNPTSQFLGYQYFHYVGDVTLPQACTDWHFRWNSCCRNPGIVNIGTNSTCVYSTLNNVQRAINNSPELTVQPIPYVCVNQPTLYLNGPVDPDFDSVVFQATTPQNNAQAIPQPGGCNPYVFNAGFTAANPLNTLAPANYQIDPTTGTAAFVPTATGVFVLAFTATDYDKPTGMMVGQSMRDVQINIVNCNTTPPTITIPGGIGSQIQNLSPTAQMISTNPVVIGVCPGQLLSFDIEATGDTSNNLVKTYANNAITCPGSTYTSNPLIGGNPVLGSFSWTPPASQIGDHTLIITFTDSTCTTGQPIVLKAYQVVLIKVLQGVDIGPDLLYCLGADSLSLPALGPPTVSQWSWTDINGGAPHNMANPNVQNPKIAPTRTATYILTTDANTACKNIDTITVYIDTAVSVAATSSDLVLCEPGYVTLDANPTGPPPSYQCGQENLTCGTPSAQYNFGTSPTSSFNITPFLGVMAGARIQMLFTPADMAAAGMVGPQRIESLAWEVINKTTQGAFNMEIKMGCSFLTDIQNYVPQSFMKKVYENNAYTTTLGTNDFNFASPFAWDGTSSVIVEICFFNATNVGTDEVASSPTPNNQFYARTSPFGGCQIPGAPGLSNPLISQNRPNTVFTSCDLPASAWQYEWEGPFIFDSTMQSTQAFINSNPSKYVVYTVGGNGCRVGDTVNVNLSNHGLNTFPIDTTICLDDRIKATALGIGDAPSETFQWFAGPGGALSDLSCTTCSDPEITPSAPGTVAYTVVRTDFYGCTDTGSISITVLPKPTVNITNGDSITIRFGQELQLFSTGATRYIWSPTWAMSNPNVSSPTIKPDENTLFLVSGLDDNGCGNYDSIYVTIDYSNNLFIPTAFSPNGDGKNDVFRIANFGFQAIQEFRVFNRWGQEVFSANDNRGWNGTFKGKDQDNGTYMYLVRVAFADGEVQTLKGDVMLLR